MVCIIPVGWDHGSFMVQPRVQNHNQGSATGVMAETYSKVWLKG